MRNSLLVAAFLGCFIYSGANAMTSLLGDNVDHPLFMWGPYHMVLHIQPSDTTVQNCLMTQGYSVINSLQALSSCATGNARGEGTSLSSICRMTAEFSSCFHEKMTNFAVICGFTEDLRKDITDAVKNNEDMTNILCGKGAASLERYERFGGFECAKTQQYGLLQCLNVTNASDVTTYDTQGCSNAYAFVDCVAREIKECSFEAGEVVEEVMKGGLQNLCEPVEGSGMPPPMEHNSTSTEEDVDAIQGQDRQHRSKEEELMETQTDLLRDIKGLLQIVVHSLSKHEELLQSIAED